MSFSPSVIIEPEIQTVYNTLYFQKLFEHDPDFGVLSNTPRNEYLSRLINLNLKTFLNSNFNNCILDGFDINITNIIDNKLYFNISKGSAILNYYFFELNVDQNNIEVEIESELANYIMIALSYNNYDKQFKIIFKLLNNNLNTIDNSLGIYNEFLPIKIYKFEYKNNTVTLLSLEDDNIFFGEDAKLYNLLNYIYLETHQIKNSPSSLQQLNKYFDIPKYYNIDNFNYLIPNYGKHYEFAIKIMLSMFRNKLQNMTMPTNITENILNMFETSQVDLC